MKNNIAIVASCLFFLPLGAMQKHEILLRTNQTEHEQDVQYSKKFYYVQDVSRKLAEAYCLQLCKQQKGFAQAFKYYNSYQKDIRKVATLESFLRRYTTEIISRAIIYRNPILKENQVSDECSRAIASLELSGPYLFYIVTNRTDGSLTQEKWQGYWNKLDQLQIYNPISVTQEIKEQS